MTLSPSFHDNLYRRRGISLVEALVALAIVSVTIIALMILTQSVLGARGRADRNLRKWSVIQERVEPGGPCGIDTGNDLPPPRVTRQPPYIWMTWNDVMVPFPCVP